MLKKLMVENVGSIHEKVELDFSKGKYTYKEEMLCNDGNHTNPHAIFGANGSGKTILLRVLDTLQEMMNLAVDNFNPFIPFLDEAYEDISRVQIQFEYEKRVFDYLVETTLFNHPAIIKEELKVENLFLKRTLNQYEVSINKEIISSGEIQQDLYSSIRKLGVEEYSDDSPINLVKLAYNYLSAITFIDVRGNILGNITRKSKIDTLMVNTNKEVNDILKHYKDFPVYELALSNSSDESMSQKLQFRREGTKNYLPEFLMSHGMKAHSRLLTVILNMKPGTLLVIDELERSLHPFVARQFVEELNRNFKIHLLFTSHNTNLLQALRPDQIFFSKWNSTKNQSEYHKLSDIYPAIREVHNIEKMYYGGLLDE